MKNKLVVGMFIIVGFMFNGCMGSFSSHPATKEYAKANNLVKPEYQESEIMCIANPKLSKAEKDKIFVLISARYHADFNEQMCKRNLKRWGGDMASGYEVFAQCEDDILYSLAQSEKKHFIRHSPESYKIEFRFYRGTNVLFSKEKRNELNGYVGFDDIDGKTIVYVADNTDGIGNIQRPSKIGFIKEGVINYMKDNPSKCKSFSR